jgi:hypothetical protein
VSLRGHAVAGVTRNYAILFMLGLIGLGLALRYVGPLPEFWRGCGIGMISATLIAEAAWKQRKWREQIHWMRVAPKKPGTYWLWIRGSAIKTCRVDLHNDGSIHTDARATAMGGPTRLYPAEGPSENRFPVELEAYWAGPIPDPPILRKVDL